MTQLPKTPSAKSVKTLLDSLDITPQQMQHIQTYITTLEQRIDKLENILAEVKPELDLNYEHPTISNHKPVDSKKPLILIVEDDAGINSMIKSIIESEGYAALSAETGQDGLDLAGHYTPDLMILDIHLPGMHGLDVIRHFKAIPRLENVPIIMLTADLFKAEASFELGADEYIMKPIRKNQLMSYVTKYLATV